MTEKNNENKTERRSFLKKAAALFLGFGVAGGGLSKIFARTNKNNNNAMSPMFSDSPFIGSIAMFAGNFAPRGWAFCNGQLLPISSNTALFSLLGTTYGGDGRTTFGVPDLRGRAPIHSGQGAGLSNRRLGDKSGTENVTLTSSQIPSHSHSFNVSSNTGNSDSPAGKYIAANSEGIGQFTDSANSTMAAAVGNAGSSQAHSNMQPYLAINFIIALEGLYPSRN